jgi:hypothetical protein
MRRRTPPSPTQLVLGLETGRNQPPPVVSTPDLLQALADLLVAAVGRPARDMPTREIGDEPEDHG